MEVVMEPVVLSWFVYGSMLKCSVHFIWFLEQFWLPTTYRNSARSQHCWSPGRMSTSANNWPATRVLISLSCSVNLWLLLFMDMST